MKKYTETKEEKALTPRQRAARKAAATRKANAARKAKVGEEEKAKAKAKAKKEKEAPKKLPPVKAPKLGRLTNWKANQTRTVKVNKCGEQTVTCAMYKSAVKHWKSVAMMLLQWKQAIENGNDSARDRGFIQPPHPTLNSLMFHTVAKAVQSELGISWREARSAAWVAWNENKAFGRVHISPHIKRIQKMLTERAKAEFRSFEGVETGDIRVRLTKNTVQASTKKATS